MKSSRSGGTSFTIANFIIYVNISINNERAQREVQCSVLYIDVLDIESMCKITKMERTGIIIIVNFVIMVAGCGTVIAEDIDSLLCCPPTTFLLFEDSDVCYDPKKYSTAPMRLVCVTTFKQSNFTIRDGNIEIPISELYIEKFSSKLACYGNITKDRNLTKVKSVALLCVTEKEEEAIVEDSTLGYCMVVSVIFLGLTAIIYTIFSELRDLFGKSVINFSASLAIGLGILAIMKLMMTYRNMASCATRGFLAYFFLLTAFFWTNSISIQVLRDTRRPSTVDYGWKEFRWYVLYSWGLPTILTVIMAIVNFHPGDHDRPGIGLNHCWFLSKTQQWYYLYSVMTILLIVNIGIFIYVATIVWRFSFRSTHLKALKFKLSMTIRLIVLMGLPWIFEMISSLAGGGQVIWAIVDVFNSLQGILVFVVLVLCRKRVIKVMHNRGLLDCCSGAVEKYLAVGDDAEDNVVQHTDVPMHDEHQTNGNLRT